MWSRSRLLLSVCSRFEGKPQSMPNGSTTFAMPLLCIEAQCYISVPSPLPTDKLHCCTGHGLQAHITSSTASVWIIMRDHTRTMQQSRNLAQATYITSLKEWHSMLEGPLPVRRAGGTEPGSPTVGGCSRGAYSLRAAGLTTMAVRSRLIACAMLVVPLRCMR